MMSNETCMVDMATESFKTWKSLKRTGVLPKGFLLIILLKKLIITSNFKCRRILNVLNLAVSPW